MQARQHRLDALIDVEVERAGGDDAAIVTLVTAPFEMATPRVAPSTDYWVPTSSQFFLLCSSPGYFRLVGEARVAMVRSQLPITITA